MIENEQYIERAIQQTVNDRFKKSKCLAITGARQVGKSTLVQHLFKDMKRVNLKSMMLSNLASEDPALFLKNYGTPLFIDEVQEVPSLLNEVKVHMDEAVEKGNYIFSGSQKWNLMKGLSESLAGTVSILEMGGLSMREIFKVSFNEPFSLSATYLAERGKKLVHYENVWEYIHRGFYPELYDEDSRNWSSFYQDYVQTYLEKDVYKLIKIRDSSLFYRFLVSVAARSGNLLNYANIASDIGVDATTVREWVSVLEKTGIVYLLEPYCSSHLSRAIKTPKLYFRDTGLCAYLTSWNSPEVLRDGAMAGAFFETFVVNEIIKSFINAGKEYTHYLYYYRGKDKSRNPDNAENEIDLIIEENGVLYPIEIKKNANVKSEMASSFPSLDKEIDKKRGMGAIVCLCEDKMYLRDNLLALPIDFI